MSRGRWQESESFEVPMTPLVDIIFILIVFFLVATTFTTKERDLKIKLPEGTEGEKIEKNIEPYVINIRASGVVVVRERILNMKELAADLRQHVLHGRKKVEIRGDADCRHRNVMGVMNLCKRLGITDYSLTQRIFSEQR